MLTPLTTLTPLTPLSVSSVLCCASISCVYLLRPSPASVSFVYLLRLSRLSHLCYAVRLSPASVSFVSFVLCCASNLVRLSRVCCFPFYVSRPVCFFLVRLSPVLSCIILPCLFCSSPASISCVCLLCCVLCCVLFCFLCVPSVSSIYPPGGILNILLRSILCCASPSMSRAPSVSSIYPPGGILPISCIHLLRPSSASISCVCVVFFSASYASRLFPPYIPLVEFRYISCSMLSISCVLLCCLVVSLGLVSNYSIYSNKFELSDPFELFQTFQSVRVVRVVRAVPKLSRNYSPELFDWLELVGVWE